MNEDQQCTAHKRNGERCKRARNLGASVCNSHGGRAPQVRRKAQQRILEASDKAAARLVAMMQDASIPAAVQLAAARDLLDRANVVGTQQINVEVGLADWERHMAEVVVDYAVSTRNEVIEDAVVIPATAALTAGPGADEDDDASRDLERQRAKRKRKTGKAFTLPSEDVRPAPAPAPPAPPQPDADSVPAWYKENPLRERTGLRPIRPRPSQS